MATKQEAYGKDLVSLVNIGQMLSLLAHTLKNLIIRFTETSGVRLHHIFGIEVAGDSGILVLKVLLLDRLFIQLHSLKILLVNGSTVAILFDQVLEILIRNRLEADQQIFVGQLFLALFI